MRNDRQQRSKCRRPDDDREKQIEDKRKQNDKTIRQRRKNIREDFFADTLRIPMDVCENALRVTLTGNSRAWIENYRGILEYTDCVILLQGKNGRVCLEGCGLIIDYYTEDDMLVRGIIHTVRFDV